jgi:hypothetical protein
MTLPFFLKLYTQIQCSPLNKFGSTLNMFKKICLYNFKFKKCKCLMYIIIIRSITPCRKTKVKMSSYRHVGAKRERKYICYSFLTSSLDGGGHAPAVIYPWHPFDRKLGGLRACLPGSNPGRPVCSQPLC